MVDTEVLDWDEAGRGKRVRLFIDAKVRKVDYTLDYSYDQPTRIEWDFVEGNGINDADGHYLFEDLGADRTRATYKLGLEVGIPLPGPVARRAHKSTLKASVEDLKKEAESRAAESARAANGDRSKVDEREAQLAEKAGIKKQSPPPAAPPASRAHSTDGGSDSLTSCRSRSPGGRRAWASEWRAVPSVSASRWPALSRIVRRGRSAEDQTRTTITRASPNRTSRQLIRLARDR